MQRPESSLKDRTKTILYFRLIPKSKLVRHLNERRVYPLCIEYHRVLLVQAYYYPSQIKVRRANIYPTYIRNSNTKSSLPDHAWPPKCQGKIRLANPNPSFQFFTNSF